MSFNLKKWKELTPNERFGKGCGWLLQIGIVLIPVYLVLEIPARILFRSEEMSWYYQCRNENKSRLKYYYNERNKIRKKLGQELDYPYIANCGKWPSRKWKWQPKDN